MNSKKDNATRLGRLLEEGYAAMDIRDKGDAYLRDAVIQMTVERGFPALRRRLVVGGVAIAAAVVTITLYFVPQSTKEFGFTVGTENKKGEVGGWIRTDVDESSEILFSDGSRFDIRESTEVRMVSAKKENVTVDLNKGRILLDVTHRAENRWAVRAGPFEVRVVGTRFGVDWDAGSSMLSVEVENGRVAVSGPGIDSAGIFVTAGNHLKANAQTALVALGPSSKPTDSVGQKKQEAIAPPALLSAETPVTTPPSTSEMPAIRQNKEQHSSFEKNLKDLIQSKKYQEALLLAKNEGLAKLQRTLSAEPLWELATTARYAGAFEDAERLFTTYRNRFSGTKKSATAAYLLGSLYIDSGQAPLVAKKWLEAYLTEAPDGPLHEEALGGLMNLNRQMGIERDARALAAGYLKKYPNGHFSKQASSILN